jgi:hypothetical protein
MEPLLFLLEANQVAGATIDHMISVTILIAALLVAMTTFNGMFASAIAYERNRQVSTKAIDLMNTVCLSPGNPADWGETNSSILGFGLQDPEAGGYALSPYSLMRLKSTSNDSQLVYYSKTGLSYVNISAHSGNSILTYVGDTVNYTTASELLGIKGTYGFKVDVIPTLNISISQVPASPPQNHLILKVETRGTGVPLGGATLNYYLFQVESGGGGSYPSINTYSGSAITESFGSALIEFPDVHESNDPYTFTVYASLSGVQGVGYYSHDTLDGHKLVVPFIQDFSQGTVIIAHSFDVHNYTETPVPEVKYNATFFVLNPDYQLHEVQIENSTDHLVYGEGNPYFTTQLPVSEVGILFISYRRDANRMGSVMLPWGIGTLGVSGSFGGDPTGYGFVATELRQVRINGISYQVKLSAWSLRG